MSETVKATRAELIATKQRIALAKNGHKLLKKKRDGLIMEFFAMLKRSRTIRAELDAQYKAALERMNMARVLEGDVRVRSAAFSARVDPSVHVGARNIIGVHVPRIEGEAPHTVRSFYDSIAITEAAEEYEKLLAKVIVAAEIETAIRKMLVEIEKTKRRVNALEFEVMPRFARDKAVIILRLDEMERENFYRLKIAKAKLALQEA